MLPFPSMVRGCYKLCIHDFVIIVHLILYYTTLVVGYNMIYPKMFITYVPNISPMIRDCYSQTRKCSCSPFIAALPTEHGEVSWQIVELIDYQMV